MSYVHFGLRLGYISHLWIIAIIIIIKFFVKYKTTVTSLIKLWCATNVESASGIRLKIVVND